MENIKLYIYGIAGAFLISIATAGYWYYSWSQDEIRTLRQNVATLEVAVDLQAETISSMERDSKAVGKQVIIVSKQFREARTENNVLRKKLAKHDVAFLAEKKPGLIQKIVNKGTANVGRCFEILSGAELTEKEKAGEINSKCTGITKVKK